MPKIPDPETLLELAESIGRSIEDREWKQYQRYLAKHKRQHGDTLEEEPLKFEEFCAKARKTKNSP